MNEAATATKTLQLKFYSGKSKTIVAKMPNGKLALADNQNHVSNQIQAGEIWETEIKDEKENCVIVTPIQKIG